ncbi:MAG: 50S ribosomal protein L23 [Candidatus Kerfeldbacteria bacterium]
MGILDKLIGKADKPKASSKEEKKPKVEEKEVERESVMTPDGKLVNVPKKETGKKKKIKTKKEDTGDAYKVLIKPMVTEKGSYLGVNNQYVFEVSVNTNKIEVKKAIKQVYGVMPINVNTINVSGKKIRYGKTEGKTKNWKKAIITLAKGDKIEIQEGL